MPIRSKRWNDPAEADDGCRLLICRYRPRGVRKEDETWDAWCKDAGERQGAVHPGALPGEDYGDANSLPSTVRKGLWAASCVGWKWSAR